MGERERETGRESDTDGGELRQSSCVLIGLAGYAARVVDSSAGFRLCRVSTLSFMRERSALSARHATRSCQPPPHSQTQFHAQLSHRLCKPKHVSDENLSFAPNLQQPKLTSSILLSVTYEFLYFIIIIIISRIRRDLLVLA